MYTSTFVTFHALCYPHLLPSFVPLPCSLGFCAVTHTSGNTPTVTHRGTHHKTPVDRHFHLCMAHEVNVFKKIAGARVLRLLRACPPLACEFFRLVLTLQTPLELHSPLISAFLDNWCPGNRCSGEHINGNARGNTTSSHVFAQGCCMATLCLFHPSPRSSPPLLRVGRTSPAFNGDT